MAGDVVLLDTDVWTHLFAIKRRTHPDSAKWRRLLVGKTVAIAVQSRAELLAWPLIRDFGDARRSHLFAQLDATTTVPVDEYIIQRYAQLTADAKIRGDALGGRAHTADRWVAATALAIDAPLLAADRIYRNDPDLVLLAAGSAA